jgi:glycosyltransferase involved in cell wall biosynthesis
VQPKLSYVTHVYFDQKDGASLDELLDQYASYSPSLLDEIEFVVVDDGSPIEWKPRRDLSLNLRVLRIEKDIPWNQAGARNLGVSQARADRVLLVDSDHLFPEETLEYCLKAKGLRRRMIRFWRRYPEEKALRRPHGNSFLCSRGRFLRFFGYDEEFAGHYGLEDEMFWRWQRYHGTHFVHAPKSTYCLLRHLDRDSSYHSLERDRTKNRTIAEKKRREWKEVGPRVGHSRAFLNFPWHVVEERQRPVEPKPQPGWAKRWWLRWLLPV